MMKGTTCLSKLWVLFYGGFPVKTEKLSEKLLSFQLFTRSAVSRYSSLHNQSEKVSGYFVYIHPSFIINLVHKQRNATLNQSTLYNVYSKILLMLSVLIILLENIWSDNNYTLDLLTCEVVMSNVIKFWWNTCCTL
jgi:hypothetical protein